MLISTHQAIELAAQHVLQSLSDHRREEDETEKGTEKSWYHKYSQRNKRLATEILIIFGRCPLRIKRK